jgi:hypothetical protein
MTIKTQGGKVITKGGKVSCTCCEAGECCMYPAEAFARGGYAADDLPDEVMIAGFLAQKREDGFPRYENEDGDFYINDPAEDDPPEDANWVVTIFGQQQFDSKCLISAYDGSAPLGVEDQFADTYTVEFYGTPPGGSFKGSATATRVSLCVWEFTAIGGTCGEGQTGSLIYSNFIPNTGADFWRIQIGSCDGGKEPIDNTTPLGTYGSADGEWRVV